VKALFLLASLKRAAKGEYSNTGVLCELLMEKLKEQGVESEMLSLIEHHIPAGTKTDMGEIDGKQDEWPGIFARMSAADIVVFATPIWWGNMSSLMQRVVERMDEVNDALIKDGTSAMLNKVGGMVITGAEDGTQSVIGSLGNFMAWNGLTVPPAPSLSYLGWNDVDAAGLMEIYKTKGSTSAMAATLARNLAHLARVLKDNPIPTQEKNAQGLH
jgi:multimeric flavodoxin WrbA